MVIKSLRLLRLTMLAGVALIPAGQASAEEHLLHTFKKVVLSEEFLSEGMYFGDFNHDGKTDVTAGSFWYAGPDFKQSHSFRPSQPFDPNGYSNAFFSFAADFNGDGWDDPLVIGFPGAEAYWYENPRNSSQAWKQHLATAVVDNESPGFGDVNGDGKPEIICHRGGFLGYAEPDWSHPEKPWHFREVSTSGGWGRFQHGLGYGDVNGDGHVDYLMNNGWWEQPSTSEGEASTQPWKFHPVSFGEGGAQMHVYDVDDDGDNDIVTSLQAHGYGLAWFEQSASGNGEPIFTKHLIVGSQASDNPFGVKFSQLHAIDLADIDGDGVKDIVTGKRYWAHGPNGDAEPSAPAVLYWFRTVREQGKVEFVPYQIDNDSGVGTQVIAADVTNDGLIDVLVGNKKGHFVFVHETKVVPESEWLAAQPKLQ